MVLNLEQGLKISKRHASVISCSCKHHFVNDIILSCIEKLLSCTNKQKEKKKKKRRKKKVVQTMFYSSLFLTLYIYIYVYYILVFIFCNSFHNGTPCVVVFLCRKHFSHLILCCHATMMSDAIQTFTTFTHTQTH